MTRNRLVSLDVMHNRTLAVKGTVGLGESGALCQGNVDASVASNGTGGGHEAKGHGNQSCFAEHDK